MKTGNSDHYPKSNKRHSLLLLLFFMFVLFTGDIHAVASGDPPKYHESGKLTEVERNNGVFTAIISEKGYIVDPSVLVVNAAGIPTSMEKLTIPADIDFEYSYSESAPKTMSPVIVYIEETKKNSNNGRSMR